MDQEKLIKKMMSKEELLGIYSKLLEGIKSLLIHKDKLGIQHLPLEFNGITSDVLYDEGTTAPSLVLFVDALVLECQGRKDDEIIERLELVRDVLVKVIENIENADES